MGIRRYKPEEVVTLLRQIEVEIANGKTTLAAGDMLARWQICGNSTLSASNITALSAAWRALRAAPSFS